ncbi:MAG: DUF4197 domain-containing protein [Sphingomonadaceae bacterium]
MAKASKIIALALVIGGFASASYAQSAGEISNVLNRVLTPKAPVSNTPTAATVSSSEANTGLKAALGKAAESVIGQLGAPGGFANDPKVRIGLPGSLGKLSGVMSALDKVGVGGGLSTKLNTAAEGAVGQALPLLKTAITSMSVSDAIGIVNGGQTSATDYFRRVTGETLQAQMKPLVSKSLSGVKAFDALGAAMAKSPVPLGKFGNTDLTSFVTQKASDGVFYYMGEQEKKIRANPIGTGSDIIARVFGKIL